MHYSSILQSNRSAEDVRLGFVPATGRIALLREPAGPGVRVDSGLFEGLTVTSDYDPLLMKLIVHGATREQASGSDLMLEAPSSPDPAQLEELGLRLGRAGYAAVRNP